MMTCKDQGKEHEEVSVHFGTGRLVAIPAGNRQ